MAPGTSRRARPNPVAGSFLAAARSAAARGEYRSRSDPIRIQRPGVLMAAAVATIPGLSAALTRSASIRTGLFVNQRSLLPLCRIRVRLRLRAPRNDHEDRFAPAFCFRHRRSNLPRVVDPRRFRAMPSRRDAGRSQASRVLFEGGQRPAAGLDGGSSGSCRGRIQGQGIAIVAGSNRDSTRLNRRIEQLRHGGSQLRWLKGLLDHGATVNALRFPIPGSWSRPIRTTCFSSMSWCSSPLRLQGALARQLRLPDRQDAVGHEGQPGQPSGMALRWFHDR